MSRKTKLEKVRHTVECPLHSAQDTHSFCAIPVRPSKPASRAKRTGDRREGPQADKEAARIALPDAEEGRVTEHFKDDHKGVGRPVEEEIGKRKERDISLGVSVQRRLIHDDSIDLKYTFCVPRKGASE